MDVQERLYTQNAALVGVALNKIFRRQVYPAELYHITCIIIL